MESILSVLQTEATTEKMVSTEERKGLAVLQSIPTMENEKKSVAVLAAKTEMRAESYSKPTALAL